MIKTKAIVEVKWNKYEFDDVEEAMVFVETCIEHTTELEIKDIEVKVVFEEEQEDKDDE